MSYSHPCICPLIPTQIDRINEQLLLLLVILIGYVNHYVNWLIEAIWKLRRAITDLLSCEISF